MTSDQYYWSLDVRPVSNIKAQSLWFVYRVPPAALTVDLRVIT